MSDDKSYYVYAAKYRGIIVYVGCGKDSRINHCRSGSSHNTGLNELYFRHKIMGDELVMTDILEGNLTKQKAEQREAIYIRRYHPICNSQLKTNSRKFKPTFENELRIVANSLGLRYVLDEVVFLADTDLLLTRFGVLIDDMRYSDHVDFSSSVCEIIGGNRLSIKDAVFDALLSIEPSFSRFRGNNIHIRNTMPMDFQSEAIKPYYYERCLEFAKIEEVFYSIGLRPVANKHRWDGRDGIPSTRYLVSEEDGSYTLYEATTEKIILAEKFKDFHFAFNSMCRTRKYIKKSASVVWNNTDYNKPKKPFFG